MKLGSIQLFFAFSVLINFLKKFLEVSLQAAD